MDQRMCKKRQLDLGTAARLLVPNSL